jgi:peptide/nickel transport system permease protein
MSAITAVVSLWWTPSDPLATSPAIALASPSIHHLLGTDEYGRDVLSRLMAGTTLTFAIAASGTAIAVVLGSVIGLLGATAGPLGLLSRGLIDLLYGFPALVLALALTSLLGTSSFVAAVAIGVGLVPFIARVIRAQTLQILRTNFVMAARTYGRGTKDILRIHVLPNLIDLLIAQTLLAFSIGIIASVGLSYLGLGPAQPTPSWGASLAEAQNYLSRDLWLVIFPIVAIVAVILSCNVLGDYLASSRAQRRRGGR